MTPARRNIHVDELIERAVSDYQRAHGLKSWSAAATEMLVVAFEVWRKRLEYSTPQWGGSEEAEEALRQEYRQWWAAREFDPAAAQDGDYSFERFIAERVAPKWGGKHSKT